MVAVAWLNACFVPHDVTPRPPVSEPASPAPPAAPAEEGGNLGELPECQWAHGVAMDDLWASCRAAEAREAGEERAKRREAAFRDAVSKEARTIARDRYGLPPTSKDFVAQTKKVARLSRPDRSVRLCNYPEGLADVDLSVHLSKIEIGLGLFTGTPLKAIEDAQKAEREQQPAVEAQVKQMLGAAEVRFVRSCEDVFWYLPREKRERAPSTRQ